MKEHDKNIESSYLQYWDVSNLCGWEILQKLSVNNFDRIKDTNNENFIKVYNEESDEGWSTWMVKVNGQHIRKLHELHNDLLFLSKRMKIEKVEKIAANLHSETNMMYT